MDGVFAAGESDPSEAALKFINQVLMEDDLENEDTCMIQESTLDAAEKSFCDVLLDNKNSVDYNVLNTTHDQHPLAFACDSLSFGHLNPLPDILVNNMRRKKPLDFVLVTQKGQSFPTEVKDDLGERSKKSFTSYVEDPGFVELFNKAMVLCNENGRSTNLHMGRKEKKQVRKKEAIDLRALLLKCMECWSENDNWKANNLLQQIRHHSCPSGNGSQRVAHYFANSLEAHLAAKNLLNKNLMLYTDLNVHRPDMLKAYKLYLTALPLYKSSNYVATEKIIEVAERASIVHLIHFGVNHGLHLPPIIQRLSKQPEGPPKLLRITGIEFPNYGLLPAERVKQTGKRLEKYCEEFNVPLEYNGIVGNWEDLSIEDLKLKGDHELLVVMCFFQMHYLSEDMIWENKSRRDIVLKLIKEINPEIFIHGTVNATYSSPFLISRFREALFHFSVLFDMFDTILAVDDKDRMVYEEQWFGRQILNVVACEGPKRVDRPESYKQWNVRTVRAGFRQVAMDGEVMERVKGFVKKSYHRDFFVEESCQWMVQGWKGRAIIALSFWKPVLRYEEKKKKKPRVVVSSQMNL
ncbi:scarecrow-like protein 14 [Impatiens glandulifera]|uniref:scarecrow-like protein 14 n=1 Tax=Impatiens glandulifera TaxID=253017 RepID=UPI001FB172E5|nr:scarecrow-like protein 14 [Impatiens glandulifera]